MARIEKESFDRTGLRSDVVTLYRGGRYHLYHYKKYTDVRLVFAPESAIASFGGDPDNFEFPWYDLDVAFFRAYEDGKPAQPALHLEWSDSGTKEGDLVFVAGHPGSTSRLNTVAHLEYLRDVALPQSLALLSDREKLLQDYGRHSAESSRQAKQDLQGIQNSKKALLGRLAGLRDPALIERKAVHERAVRERIAANPASQEAYGDAWDKISHSFDAARRTAMASSFLEGLGILLAVVLDRADDRPPGRGRCQAQRRPAARIRRRRPGVAGTSPLFARPNLCGIRRSQAGAVARVLAA